MIGQTIGSFRIIEQIGVGGTATVYKAYDPAMDRYVALKILPHQFANDPQFRERFKREAKAIAGLEHLHILPIFTYGEEDGIAYMAMRYLEAGTLTDRLLAGPLSLAETGRILRQIAAALDYAHARSILHRDVKPSNVLLDDNDNAYLTDFGLAKIVEATLDLTGDRILGTPSYMSPEQCQGVKNLTAATDIYSLGIVLYEMVTGKRPFQAETPIAVILKQLNDPLPPPRQLRPDLPEGIERVIYKALAKAPESRYQTAGDLAAAYETALAKHEARQPTQIQQTAAAAALPDPQPEPETAVAVPSRQFPRWAIGLLTLLAAAGLVAIGFAVSNRSRQSPPLTANDSRNVGAEPGSQRPLAADALCAPGEELLFFDDFEDGDISNWHLSDEDGRPDTDPWRVERHDDNHVLIGQGHAWAVAGNDRWRDYVLHVRVRVPETHPVDKSGTHINVMLGNSRYYLHYPLTYLRRDDPRQPDQPLGQVDGPADHRWHTITISVVGDHVIVLQDGREIIRHAENRPLPDGQIGLENLNGVVWYDDVLVCRPNP